MTEVKKDLFLEDQLRQVIKEINPSLESDMISQTKILDYTCLSDYIEKSHRLHKAIYLENMMGTVIIIRSKDPSPIKNDNGRLYINLDSETKILNIKLKGLEFERKSNGNNYSK